MPRAETDYDRINRENPIREVMRRYGVVIRGTGFKCPFHDDQNESGSIYTGKTGIERWHCHPCQLDGDAVDFIKRIRGCTHREALIELQGHWQGPPRAKPEPPKAFQVRPFPPDLAAKFKPGRPTPLLKKRDNLKSEWSVPNPTMIHRYENEAGEVVMIVVRYQRGDGGKSFKPVRFTDEHGCISTAWQPKERRYFYRENELRRRPDDPVLVVEGEKCADVLSQLQAFDDYVVIGWHGGAQSGKFYRWPLLKGRTIVFWPDADKVKPEDLEKNPERLGEGEEAMILAAEKVGEGSFRMVIPDETWFDKAKGYDAFDLVEEIGAEAARAEMESRAVEYRPPPPPPPPEEPPPEPPHFDRDGEPIDYILIGEGVRRGLKRNEPSNWWRYIARDPRFGHELQFDVVTRTVLCDGLPVEPDSARFHDIVHELGTVGPWHTLHATKVGQYLLAAAKDHPVNRVLDAIRSVAWDGQRRELAGYLMARPDAWAQTACNRWLLGLVHRIVEPGWKHDGMLVLEGPQGVSKTTFFRLMGHIHGFDLYGNLSKLVQERDIQKQLGGKVVVELGEMTAVRSGRESLKQMLTDQEDEYRDFYEVALRKVPRTCVFGGTTNERQYLPDTTGNRRYWIVEIEREHRLDELEQDLPQLLAQALTDVENGVQNWLTPEETAMQEAMAADRELDDPMFDDLEKVLAGDPRKVLSRNDVFELLHIGRDRRPSNERCKMLSRKLEKLGWTYQRRIARWHRPDPDSDIPL